MAAAVTRRGNQKSVPMGDAKRIVLDEISRGLTREAAAKKAGRTLNTFLDWMKTDPLFRQQYEDLRRAREGASIRDQEDVVPDFETFAREWLKEPAFPHHMRMIDVIEGRAPRDLHQSMVYEPGMPGLSILNLPPGGGKTSQITTNYVVHRIHRNPSISVLIISKSKEFAKNILWDIKRLLTDSQFREMHQRFSPGGEGWESDDPWTQDAIYVRGKSADGGGEKDPTVQVLGIKGQIYGRRADLIIVDDAVDELNVNDYESQQRWLMKTVYSRLPPTGGQLILVGTRMGTTDLYSTMRDVTNDYAEPGDPARLFTYLSQPAVLDYGDGTPASWVSYWPETFDREGNLVPRWPGMQLARRRNAVGERSWALVYQQQDITDDAVFHEKAIECSINRARFPGVMSAGGMGHRAEGMEGLYVVLGIDPASVGYTAMVVVGLDRANRNADGAVQPKRYVLDGANVESIDLADMQNHIKRFVELYGVNEVVIERNAAQLFLLQDKNLNSWMQGRGVRMTPHHTNVNKLDPDFGVMGMSQLFASCGRPGEQGTAQWKRAPWGDMAIELPDPRQNSWVGQLVNQLVTWQPSGMKPKTKTDLVMALWFTEIVVQRILGYGQAAKPKHRVSPWMTPANRKQQTVVNVADLRQQKLLERQVA